MPRISEAPPSRPAYFWWFLLNILALCFAVSSWVVCLQVFGNPEVPRNYEILKRLGRQPQIKRHTALNAPNGAALDPAGLYARFRGLDAEKRTSWNSLLIRNYLTNFEDLRALTYAEGEYRVESVRALGEKDFIPQGFVVRARAMVRPDENAKPVPYPVVIDHVYPTANADAMSRFRRGDVLQLSKSLNCAAMIQVDLVEDEEDALVCLAVVPITYGSYQVSDGFRFEIEPPTYVVPGAPFPFFRK